MSNRTILIVEDDEAIATGLELNLKLAGYVATVVHDGESALAQFHAQPPTLLLLDINLPKKNGLEVLSDLRRGGSSTPVIVLSAREDEFDKVAALRLGADDYVTKPFSLAELMARVDAVLRRTGGGHTASPAAAHRFGDVVVDLATRTVSRGGEPVKLTPLELELLSFLVRNPSRVFTREQLLRQVWGQSRGSLRTVDNFVAQLRGKLERDPEQPRHIITVRGSGYRFDP
jgi:two-component system, OmpR family, alkaline phosphatase synthesis response regulator PhoP